MLVLDIHPGQGFTVGEAYVKVLGFKTGERNIIRIGVQAPESVRVVRDNAKVKTPKGE